MIVLIKKSSFLSVLVLFIIVCMGCSEPEKEKPVVFIIKSRLISISESDFFDELDLKKSAYPYKITENPLEYNEMVMNLVNMLTEEVLLLSAAVDHGVVVTEDEVKAAEVEFKKDYPENSFDKMLLENAISYSLWKKRLKTNLIIDKLIDQEIRNKIEISSEELVEFYKKYNMEAAQDTKKKNKEPKKNIDENELVFVLRMQKMENEYQTWIKALELKYPVEINKDRLKSLLKNIEENRGSKNEKKD